MKPKLETVMTFWALSWMTWEIFFAMGLNLLEFILIFNEIEYNDMIIILIRILFIGGFLAAFVWVRRRPDKEIKQIQRQVI